MFTSATNEETTLLAETIHELGISRSWEEACSRAEVIRDTIAAEAPHDLPGSLRAMREAITK